MNNLYEFFKNGGYLRRIGPIQFEGCDATGKPLGAFPRNMAEVVLDMMSTGVLKMEQGNVMLGEATLEDFPAMDSREKAQIIDMIELKRS